MRPVGKRKEARASHPNPTNHSKLIEDNSYYKQYDSKRQLKRMIEEQTDNEPNQIIKTPGRQGKPFKKKTGGLKLERIRSDMPGLEKGNYLFLFEEELRRKVGSETRSVQRKRKKAQRKFSKTDYLKYLREIDASPVDTKKSSSRGSSPILEEVCKKFEFAKAFMNENGEIDRRDKNRILENKFLKNRANRMKMRGIQSRHAMNRESLELNSEYKHSPNEIQNQRLNFQAQSLSKSLGFKLGSGEDNALNQSEFIAADNSKMFNLSKHKLYQKNNGQMAFSGETIQIYISSCILYENCLPGFEYTIWSTLHFKSPKFGSKYETKFGDSPMSNDQ